MFLVLDTRFVDASFRFLMLTGFGLYLGSKASARNPKGELNVLIPNLEPGSTGTRSSGGGLHQRRRQIEVWQRRWGWGWGSRRFLRWGWSDVEVKVRICVVRIAWVRGSGTCVKCQNLETVKSAANLNLMGHRSLRVPVHVACAMYHFLQLALKILKNNFGSNLERLSLRRCRKRERRNHLDFPVVPAPEMM